MPSPNRQIDMGEPRLFEDFRLANSTPARMHEIQAVSTAYDSVLCADFTYVSTPITSGAILYEAMTAAGVSTLEELRKDSDLFYQKVILHNLAAADSVAQTMLSFGGAVIAPAAFEARALGWDQDAYMGLWLDTIERKATRLALVDGWEYSNGGAEEYLQALLMQAGRRDRNNIEIVDARGEVLSHKRGIELLAAAIAELLDRNFKPTVLAQVLHRAIKLHGFVRDEGQYGHLADECGRNQFSIAGAYFDAMPSYDDYRDTVQGTRSVQSAILSLLPPEEQQSSCSLAMAPGLVRSDGRKALTEYPAKVIGKATTTPED